MARMTGEFDVFSELHYEGRVLTEEKRLGTYYEFNLGNRELPVFEHKDTIIDAVDQHRVAIIVGGTGTGKSTQVPQYLLETGAYDQIKMSQPRRLAASNVYGRIKQEVGAVCGAEVAEDWVGFKHAGEEQGSEYTLIKVVTDGLQKKLEMSDKGVTGPNVVIIDEAHEANERITVLVSWVKELVKVDPLVHVVLMSASMDAERLARYFEDAIGEKPPIIEIEGKMFDVDVIERPDSTVADTTVELLSKMRNEDGLDTDTAGDIMLFLPGKGEIKEQMEEVRRGIPPEMKNIVKLFPLHSNLSSAEQQAALTEYPGCVRVIFSTDITESSLTVPGLKYIVDAGLKRPQYVDDEGAQGLVTIEASQANLTQRKGRVGRVCEGVYILTRLNKHMPYVPIAKRPPFPDPEIMHTDVQSSVLELKQVGIEMREWDMFDRAPSYLLKLADVHLELLDATNGIGGDITPIGLQMNQFPISTSSSRIMVESLGYPESVRSYLAAVTAARELGGLQFYGRGANTLWQDLSQETQSDLLVQLDLFIAAQHMTNAELWDYGFDVSALQRAREQFAKIASRAHAPYGLLEPPTKAEREQIVECSLVGFMPTIYYHNGDGTYVNISNKRAPTPREISRRSCVVGTPEYLVGDPWRVEVNRNGNKSYQHLIHNVTVVTREQLARLAAKRTIWRVDDYRIRGENGIMLDKPQQVEKAYAFDNHHTGRVRYVEPDPSYALRIKIIEESLESPGAEQRRLRELKKELEELGHKAKHLVPQLTQDELERLVHEAAPHNITNPATIEDNLRAMRFIDPKRSLTIESFISQERIEEIKRNAPDEITIGETTHALLYQQGKPLVQVHDPSFSLSVDDEHAYLPDGREIKFIYLDSNGRSRHFTLRQLQAAALNEMFT